MLGWREIKWNKKISELKLFDRQERKREINIEKIIIFLISISSGMFRHMPLHCRKKFGLIANNTKKYEIMKDYESVRLQTVLHNHFHHKILYTV